MNIGMSSTSVISMAPPKSSKARSVALVFCCTFLGAAAQLLIKTGANSLTHAGLAAMATNLPLLAGYTLYGMSTVLLVLALKNGQLSILYPIISLTYVWVTILSVLVFKESMNPFKLAGLTVIVLGVGVLGKDSH